MSYSGNVGFVAIGKQADKSTPQVTQADLFFMEAVSAPFVPMDEVRVRKPVIGDSPLPRGMYKVGTGVQSGFGIEVTPSGIGPALAYALGADTVAHEYELDLTAVTSGTFTLTFDPDGAGAVAGVATAAVDFDANAAAIQTAVNAPESISNAVVTQITAPSAGVRGGKFKITGITHASNDNNQALSASVGTVTHAGKHTIKMSGADKYSVPYISLIRNVGNAIQEIGVGCKVAEAGVSFVVRDPVSAEFGVIGLKPKKDATSLTAVYDNEDVLTTTNSEASFTFTITDAEGNVETYDTDAIDVLACVVRLQNMITPPNQRRRIGSVEAVDLTVLDRMAVVEVAMEISDPAFHQAVTYDQNGAWREIVAKGSIVLTAGSPSEFGQKLVFSSSNMVWSNFQIIAEPQDIVRATVTGTILRDGTGNEIKFEVTNSHTKSYLE